MIFEILKYTRWPSGVVDLQLSGDAGNGRITMPPETFMSEINAIWHVRQMAKETYFGRYRAYVNAAKKSYETSNGVIHSIEKDKSIKLLTGTLNPLWEKNFDAICKNIHYLRDHIYKILPAESHQDYAALRSEALEICSFAKAHLNFEIQNLITNY